MVGDIEKGNGKMKTQRDIDHIKGLCDDLKNEVDELGDNLLAAQEENIDLQKEIDRLQEELDAAKS